MRSVVPLSPADLTSLVCPWCGRTPGAATAGFKVVRDRTVLGLVAVAPSHGQAGVCPHGAVVIEQLWVRREDVEELIGTQLVQRVAGQAVARGARCLVARGTRGAPDCRHLPGDWLDRVGFVEHVAGVQWRLDFRRTASVLDAVRGVTDAAARLVRGERPATASRWGRDLRR